MQSFRSHRIVTETEVIDGWLTVNEDGRIEAVEMTPSGKQINDYENDWLFPGLIDPHLHGFMGWNASKTSDETQILRMADALLWAGVTACVPSCISSEFMLDNVKALHAARVHQKHGSEILGLYMEGPFYNPEYNGGTPIETFENASVKRTMEYVEAAGGDLVSLGLAPELPGAMEVVSFLSQNGVRVGIAHTGADYEQTIAAIDAGCKMATHSFNAMRGLHHREVGVTGAILLDPRIYNEINCDFIHVCPQMIEILLKMKSWDKILMMTDNDSMTGMPVGQYRIDNVIETLEPNGKIMLEDGTIYGSGRLLLQDVFNLIDILNIPVPEAVAMASLNAARFLNVDDRLGSLKAGKQADFIVVNDQQQCRATIQKGVCVCDQSQRDQLVNPKFMNLKIA
ncbi:N-acetylglucosamine-6-phosphate deacetylase [Holdemania filiformis]|uniref:N-acetylglucosamine-6-phosphate deacetylase n=1 Tax=Holdemania filiformis TaxID=61171 RepID=UPI002676716E|nr:N-acetylglucosamine-6-phosphate deacetylase [Holdemania filiformis]